MRVVLDTNILISACWTPGGNEWRVLSLAKSGLLGVCLSDALEAEYQDVAQRRKFAKYQQCLALAIGDISAIAVRVQPQSICKACTDPDDNLLLDCAAAGGAQYVITGNLRDFPTAWNGIGVINARMLLDQMGG
ncbi:MAG: putative toxin-antitoxin system toxin component, PIN family [Acidobacteria bacterium]|nr:putative toxin-antitoxin system toxin component, PIN family [Acidobacteriota bacterium]